MRRALVILAVIGALIAAILNIPLAWTGPKFVPSIMGQDLRYSGTVWRGTVQGVDLVETVNFRMSPAKILTDTPLFLEAGNGRNALTMQLGRQHLSDMRLSLNVADLPLPDQRLKGLQGTANLSIPSAEFDQTCRAAAGNIRTDILKRNGRKFAWTGPILQGPIRCEDGNVIAELSGQENGQMIRGTITINPNGTYTADISVTTAQSEAAAVLPLFGFSKKGREFVLTEQGKWR